LKDARAAAAEQRAAIRREGDDAAGAMQKFNRLKIAHADDAVVAEWRQQVEAVYPKIRGRMVPEKVFDEVKRLRDEYRSQRSQASK
jgi:hypothetical protein